MIGQNGEYVEALLETYFSDPQYQVLLNRGEVLMRQGDPNDRLYVLLEGRMRAEQVGDSGQTSEVFQAKSHRFLGVYSFFSETYSSVMTLVAEENCKLAYLDRERFYDLRRKGDPLFERFMPVVVTELVDRYRQTQELTIAREQAFQKLVETEKVASLGQMAAGVAHELNNAIAVLERNCEWVSKSIEHILGDEKFQQIYQRGLVSGNQMHSRERRQKRIAVQKKYGLDAQQAEKFVELGLEDVPPDRLPANLDTFHLVWKMGTALHDALVASRQAAHVVRSMKLLGMPSSEPSSNVNVNETIHDALALIKTMLDGVEVVLKLGEVPNIRANAGEMVQVWLNLLKNACESMDGVSHPKIVVESIKKGKKIQVSIADVGCGISQSILPHIFQPNVTTKVDGLSFGLGLGLPIVQRLIHRINGKIQVRSQSGSTVFTVDLPLENE